MSASRAPVAESVALGAGGAETCRAKAPAAGLLLDCRGIMEYLGVKRHVAEEMMRQLPKVVGLGGTNRVYVYREDVLEGLRRRTVRA
jgi:hypothetical protein